MTCYQSDSVVGGTLPDAASEPKWRIFFRQSDRKITDTDNRTGLLS